MILPVTLPPEQLVYRADVKRARRYQKMTQLEFAELLGVSIKLVQAWEQGKKRVRLNYAPTILALCQSGVCVWCGDHRPIIGGICSDCVADLGTASG